MIYHCHRCPFWRSLEAEEVAAAPHFRGKGICRVRAPRAAELERPGGGLHPQAGLALWPVTDLEDGCGEPGRIAGDPLWGPGGPRSTDGYRETRGALEGLVVALAREPEPSQEELSEALEAAGAALGRPGPEGPPAPDPTRAILEELEDEEAGLRGRPSRRRAAVEAEEPADPAPPVPDPALAALEELEAEAAALYSALISGQDPGGPEIVRASRTARACGVEEVLDMIRDRLEALRGGAA